MPETLAVGFLVFVGIMGALNPIFLYLRRRAFGRLLKEQLESVEFAPLREALAEASPNPIPFGRIAASAIISAIYAVSLWTVLNG